MRPLTPANKKLSECARFLEIKIEGDGTVKGISSNSRDLQAGEIFAALPGEKFHGARFASDAASRGSIAILTDAEGSRLIKEAGLNLPILTVDNPRALLGPLASFIYGNPSKAMKIVGVTGTNGKTTTTHLLFQIFRAAGLSAGLIGTVGNQIDGEQFPATHTTPESDELQRIFAVMAERGVQAAAIEVSSHALAQYRVDGTRFATVGFTNLTQDHLDYHGTMENYFAAKSRLFGRDFASQGSIVIDGAFGKKLSEISPFKTKSVSRGKERADWHLSEAIPYEMGYKVSISGPDGISIQGEIPLFGDHNLENALLAISLAHQCGISVHDIKSALPTLRGAPGRLERIDRGQGFIALVDYAHTPDAVRRILSTARNLTKGKVIAVLGCGGDRDSSKRPLMGAALTEGADIPIFTSDNPRSEDPMKIIREMTQGVALSHDARVIVDRREAINEGVRCALEGDVLIVLGKGHETGQEISGTKHPFDDRIVLSELIHS